MDSYFETSALLLALSDSEAGIRAKERLSELKGSAAVSDLVLSEIYNLPEPLKDRSTRLVVELGVPSVRLTLSCFNLVDKYLYNKAIESSKRDWGLHLTTAAVRGFKRLITADSFFAELAELTNPINSREGYAQVEVELLPVVEDEKLKGWLGELLKVREISYRATVKRGVKEILKGIETSTLHLMKEKSVTIERTGSIEIF